MNREIKFRAWDQRDKKMVYPPSYMRGNQGFNTVEFWEWVAKNNEYVCRDNNACVVQQFTGLKDKNGKEIYEGDILKVQPENIIGYVEFLPKNACYTLLGEKKYMRYDMYLIDEPELASLPKGVTSTARSCAVATWRLEIIGNILENPELLK